GQIACQSFSGQALSKGGVRLTESDSEMAVYKIERNIIGNVLNTSGSLGLCGLGSGCDRQENSPIDPLHIKIYHIAMDFRIVIRFGILDDCFIFINGIPKAL